MANSNDIIQNDENTIEIDPKIPLLGSYIAIFLNNAQIADENGNDRALFYRGQSDKAYKLTPSVFRKGLLAKEHSLIQESLLNSPIEFSNNDTSFERLIKMQHYGLPTRLLDVTLNPLVALYFACKELDDCDGEVIVFYEYMKYPSTLEVRYLVELAEYSGSTERQMLGFLSERGFGNIGLGDLTRITNIPIKAPRSNERIRRQQGAFIILGVLGSEEGNPYQKASFDLKPLMVRDFGDSISRSIVIPKEHKTKLLKELDVLGINNAVLFPELEHQTAYIRNLHEEVLS